ncbi:MAG: tRNA (adenosine(37)-N6)-threonylcarbamoyltransferase complex dimerization subunit type 1 TsaB [Nitrococcus mobilis]|nr:tRNA (adenosine(37)-N6)-threonylcarbamoyltransferase complex dimerization subunit type 1 TsaB [Nitrococcus mobilis]
MNGPRILAFDTTTEACSAALSTAQGVFSRSEIMPRGHTRRLLPLLDELLGQAALQLSDLDAIAYCCGPGSFTGIRIAAGVAQGLAYGANRPLIPVSTLACLAQGVYREQGGEVVLTAVDARMDEVYWGVYQLAAAGIMVARADELVVSPDEVPVPPLLLGAWYGVGSGWRLYKERLMARCGKPTGGLDGGRLPDARDCLSIAHARYFEGALVGASEALPVYLRNRVT